MSGSKQRDRRPTDADAERCPQTGVVVDVAPKSVDATEFHRHRTERAMACEGTAAKGRSQLRWRLCCEQRGAIALAIGDDDHPGRRQCEMQDGAQLG